MTARNALAAALPVALVLLALPAQAQRRRPPPAPPPPAQPATPGEPTPAVPEPDSTEDARRLFEQGVAQMEALDFAGSIATFQQSLGIRRSPSATFNLGLAQRGAGEYVDALETFRAFVEMPTGQPALRVSANALITELEGTICHVQLTVRGGAADLRIDDQVQDWNEGTRDLVMNPGPHRFVATREGYAPAEMSLDLRRGQSIGVSLDVADHPLPGRLSIETGLRTAEIRVNGERGGLGEYATEVPAGRYRVEVRASGFIPQRREVELRPGGVVRIAVTMAREQRPGLLTRWWFWTIVGAAATGAIATAIYLNPSEGPYYDGTLGFTVEALDRR